MKKAIATKPDRPDVYADRLSKLTPDERAHLRAILLDPIYVRLLRIVAVFKPSPFCTNAGSTARDQFSDARTNARLGEIRGWESHENAIFLALNEPPKVKTAVQETFPDAGRIDAEWTMPAEKPKK